MVTRAGLGPAHDISNAPPALVLVAFSLLSACGDALGALELSDGRDRFETRRDSLQDRASTAYTAVPDEGTQTFRGEAALGAGEATETHFTLALLQAGIGGKVKVLSVTPAPPLTMASENLVGVTTYPGAPTDGRKDNDGKYFSLLPPAAPSSATAKGGNFVVVVVAAVFTSLFLVVA